MNVHNEIIFGVENGGQNDCFIYLSAFANCRLNANCKLRSALAAVFVWFNFSFLFFFLYRIYFQAIGILCVSLNRPNVHPFLWDDSSVLVSTDSEGASNKPLLFIPFQFKFTSLCHLQFGCFDIHFPIVLRMCVSLLSLVIFYFLRFRTLCQMWKMTLFNWFSPDFLSMATETASNHGKQQ